MSAWACFQAGSCRGCSLLDVWAHLLQTMLAVHGLPSWQLVLLAALQASRQAVYCVLGMHVGALHSCLRCCWTARGHTFKAGCRYCTNSLTLHKPKARRADLQESGPDS